MNKKTVFHAIALTSLITLTACRQTPLTQQSGYYGNQHPQGTYQNTQNTQVNSLSTLTPQLQSSIQYMYSEERLAKSIYLDIYKKQPIRQLYNIATRAETRHIDAVNDLAKKYGLNTTSYPNWKYQEQELQNLYNKLYSKGIRSEKDALEVGCMVEVVDINDLNKYMAQAQASNAQDVISVFNQLRQGSYNHYWAFDRALKNISVSNGCCSLGQEYCHPEYPQNSKGGQRGQGRGHGRGLGRRQFN